MKYAFGICPLCKNLSFLQHEVCSQCLSALLEQRYSTCYPRFCPVCYAPQLHEQAICNHNNVALPIIRIMPYIDTTKRLVLSYKKTGIKRLSWTFAHIMIPYLRLIPGSVALVPIPCSKRRLYDFGWDHMKRVVSICGSLCSIPTLSLLKRTNLTSQKHLDRCDRLNAATEAYQVHAQLNARERRILDKTQVLIVCDDVMTTGASMHVCMRVLEQHFGKTIVGLCVAMD